MPVASAPRLLLLLQVLLIAPYGQPVTLFNKRPRTFNSTYDAHDGPVRERPPLLQPPPSTAQ